MNDQDKLAGLQGKDTGTTMPSSSATPTVKLPGANASNPPLASGANPDGTISTASGKTPVGWQDIRRIIGEILKVLESQGKDAADSLDAWIKSRLSK